MKFEWKCNRLKIMNVSPLIPALKTCHCGFLCFFEFTNIVSFLVSFDMRNITSRANKKRFHLFLVHTLIESPAEKYFLGAYKGVLGFFVVVGPLPVYPTRSLQTQKVHKSNFVMLIWHLGMKGKSKQTAI